MSRAVNVIKAVHDVDLKRVLRRLGLYEKLARGELRCAVCGRPLIAGKPRRAIQGERRGKTSMQQDRMPSRGCMES